MSKLTDIWEMAENLADSWGVRADQHDPVLNLVSVSLRTTV